MEFILGMLFTPAALGALILFSLLFEYKEARGFAGLFFVGAAVVLYNLLGLTLQTVAIAVAVWIPIGIAWSIWRWSRHCSMIVKLVEQEEIEKPRAIRELDFKRSTPTLVYWVIFWPISLLEMVLSDFFDLIETLVTKVFKNTYARITDSAMSKINDL